MMVAAVLMMSTSATMAQKVNVDSFKSKMAKSDEVIKNEKKAKKASTWISRGNTYLDALQAPTESLFITMDLTMLKAVCGNPKSTTEETINNVAYKVLTYNFVKVYLANDKVVGWKNLKQIKKGSDKVAFEAFAKACELDPKAAGKAKDGMTKLANYYAQIGDISNTLADYKVGGQSYTAVYDVQSHPAYNVANPMMLYYAGYMYTIGANDDKSLYAAGAKALNRAIKAGYAETEQKATDVEDKDKGNIFYYLYHCYYGQKDADKANLVKAKEALLKGIEMFPKNQKMVDALTQLYTTEEGLGDPSELIGMIDSSISEDPTNADLWFARGRIYFALKDYDNCISSFEKVTELAPEVFDGHFYLGLFYIYKGDAMNEVIGTKTYTDNASYAKDLNENNAIYAAAIPILERAHELRSDDLATVEYLKFLSYRLRDMDGIAEK